MEEGNDSTLELRTTTSVDRRGWESLPNDRLANIGSNKKRDTRPQTITLLEKFVQKDDDERSDDQLQNEQQADYDATEDELQELKAVILKIQGFIVKVTFSMIFVTNITKNINRFANHLRRRSFF